LEQFLNIAKQLVTVADYCNATAYKLFIQLDNSTILRITKEGKSWGGGGIAVTGLERSPFLFYRVFISVIKSEYNKQIFLY
jgi:hypothetical protein